MEILGRYEILTETPGRASIIKNRIDLPEDHPIRYKPYPVQGEIQEKKITMETEGEGNQASPMHLCW